MTITDREPRYAEHRARLQEERRFRVEQLAALRAETPQSPRHEGVTRLLRVSATVALAEVDAALARIDDGSYGLCVSCGGRLSAERLAALPSASWCLSCHFNEQNCRLAPSFRAGRG
jgi:RNA polymerase-binding transcription factor DksA